MKKRAYIDGVTGKGEVVARSLVDKMQFLKKQKLYSRKKSLERMQHLSCSVDSSSPCWQRDGSTNTHSSDWAKGSNISIIPQTTCR